MAYPWRVRSGDSERGVLSRDAWSKSAYVSQACFSVRDAIVTRRRDSQCAWMMLIQEILRASSPRDGSADASQWPCWRCRGRGR